MAQALPNGRSQRQRGLDFRVLGEVSRSLPLVRSIVRTIAETAEELTRNKAERREIRRRLKELGGQNAGKETLSLLRDEGEDLTRELQQQARELAELGGVLVDPLSGQVDFASHLEEEPVMLCWRPEDASICFFHEIDETCDRRQPLTHTVPR